MTMAEFGPPDADSAGLGLGFDVQLGVSLHKVLGRIEERMARDAEARSRLSVPSFYRPMDVVQIANGVGVVRLGGPDMGHMWYVQSVTVGGLDPTVAAAGVADIYVTAMDLRTPTGGAVPSLADWRDRATSLPLVAFYSPEQIPLRGQEELFVRFSAATNGQTYVAVAQVTDMQEGVSGQAWGR